MLSVSVLSVSLPIKLRTDYFLPEPASVPDVYLNSDFVSLKSKNNFFQLYNCELV